MIVQEFKMSECVPSNTPLTNTGFGYTRRIQT